MVVSRNVDIKNTIVNFDSNDFDLSKVSEETNLPQLLNELRKKIDEDDKLNCPMDDDFLSMFIRGRKYNVNWAFKTVKCYIKILSKSPEFATTLYPSAQQGFISIPGMLTVGKSKYRSQGEQNLIIRVAFWDAAMFNSEDMLNSCLLSALHMIRTSAETNIQGLNLVIDVEGFTWSHLAFFTPSRMQKTITMMQNGIPARIKGIHVLNNFTIFQLGFSLVKPFLKEKLKKRIIFHGYNYQKSLVKALGGNALPQSLGGNTPDNEYELTDFYSTLLTQDDYYKEFLMGGYGYGNSIRLTGNRYPNNPL